MGSTKWSPISVCRAITFTRLITNTKFKRRLNWTGRRTLRSLGARPSRKNPAQAKMFKLSNKLCETSSITKGDKCRRFIQTLKKEELQPNHQLLTIWGEKSRNGRYGTVTLRSLNVRRKRTRRRKTSNITTRSQVTDMDINHKEEGTQHLSGVAWR